MSDNEVKVEVGATTDKLTAGMQQAAATVQSGVSEITAHLEGMNAMFGKITAGFAMFTAALAGGSALKSFVSGAMDATKEAVVLGKTLGITATDASYFKAALASVGVSTETVSAAANKITMTLLRNEKAFKDLGVASRDSSGNLRNTKDIMLDTNEALRAFKEGTDRNIEGMKIYGRQWAEIAPLVSKFKGETEETRRSAEALNLVVGQEAVADMANYKVAQIGVKEVMEGITNTIGREIIPRLAELGNWFKSIGPDAVTATRIAMQGYLVVQDSIKDSIKAVWSALSTAVSSIVHIFTDAFGEGGSTITAMQFFQNVVKVVQVAFIGFRIGIEEACAAVVGAIDGVIIVLKGLAAIAVAALHFDWQGVKDAAADMGNKIVENFDGTVRKMTVIAQKGADDIDAALSKDISKAKPVTPIAAKEGGETSEGGGKVQKDKDDRMKKWEADLLKQKTNYMIENDMREMSLSDEASYWRKIVATLADGDNAKSSAQKKLAEAEFADMKRQAKQRMDLQIEVMDFQQKMDLAGLDKERQAADQRVALGIENDAQRLRQEEGFENAKYAINVKALQDRLELMSKDPTTNLVERQKILDQLLEMEQKHANDVTKIQNKQVVEARKPFMDFIAVSQNAFKQSLSGMLQGTTTFAGAMKGLFKGILGAFADMVSEMVAKWLTAMVMNRVSQAATGVAQVMSNAAVAGSAAFASIAAIPMVGPMMAPAAAAAAYAGTMSFAPLASARDGYDIPRGINPVTQLHEREMVLPQAQADAVRDMAAGGGVGAPMQVHIHAVDAKSVERLFKENGRAIAASLQNQMRNFAVKTS